jgi:hypothetical protein
MSGGARSIGVIAAEVTAVATVGSRGRVERRSRHA